MRKLITYIKECLFCRRGATARDAIRLVMVAFGFHLRNLCKMPASNVSPKCYRIRLAGKTIPVWLRPGTGDVFVFFEVFLSGCYQIPERWICSRDVVIDLGANIGLTSLFLSAQFPRAHFYCVEPSPSNPQVLRMNAQYLADKVSVIESAVADQTGEVVFDVSRPSWGGRISPECSSGVRVPCTTMSEFLKREHITRVSLLKMDVEGAERFIFASDLDWLNSVELMIIELHDGYSFEELSAQIGDLGFAVHRPTDEYGNLMIIARRDNVQQTRPLALAVK